MIKKVSVSLLTYNSLQYLPGCLPSILSQTYPNLEVAVVDNASSDGTVNVFRENHPDLRLFVNEKNLGHSGGHNQGIRFSDGEYVLIINPDVVLTPTVVYE